MKQGIPGQETVIQPSFAFFNKEAQQASGMRSYNHEI